jgi:hypothetical protein
MPIFRSRRQQLAQTIKRELDELRAWLDNDFKAEGYRVRFSRVLIGGLFIDGMYWRKISDTQADPIPQTDVYPLRHRLPDTRTYDPDHAVFVTSLDWTDAGTVRDTYTLASAQQYGPSPRWQAYWDVLVYGVDPWRELRERTQAKLPDDPEGRERLTPEKYHACVSNPIVDNRGNILYAQHKCSGAAPWAGHVMEALGQRSVDLIPRARRRIKRGHKLHDKASET